MPTTVHIPDDLLTSLDARAKELGISRNKLVVQAVERELRARNQWPPGFIEAFSNVSDEDKQAVDEMLAAIKSSRRSKAPIEF